MNMRGDGKPYNFIMKDSDLMPSSNWFRGVDFGSPNGEGEREKG
jgi:hypothetical protein